MAWWAGIPLGLVVGAGGLIGLLCLMSRASGDGWLGYWR
jgi:hypothetical protein